MTAEQKDQARKTDRERKRRSRKAKARKAHILQKRGHPLKQPNFYYRRTVTVPQNCARFEIFLKGSWKAHIDRVRNLSSEQKSKANFYEMVINERASDVDEARKALEADNLQEFNKKLGEMVRSYTKRTLTHAMPMLVTTTTLDKTSRRMKLKVTNTQAAQPDDKTGTVLQIW